MITRSNNKSLAILLCTMLAILMSPISHAQIENANGKFTGFEQGNHKGHENEKGKHKGLDNERNPWSGSNNDPGIDFDLTIINHAITPMVTVTLAYNSQTTIGEVLVDIVGEPIDGFIIQDCYVTSGPLTITDCPTGQSPVQLDNDLTLETAGRIEDPKVHIVYIGG